MLINDVDLLRIEPNLFLDAASIATSLVSGTDGSVTGTTFTSAGSDFVASDITTGDVAVINSEPVEVDTRTNLTTLEVSRPRSEDIDPKIEPTSGTTLTFNVLTFIRHITQEQAWVLGGLGIDPAHPDTPLDETAIIDTSSIERLIALRVIAQVYEQASAANPTNAVLLATALNYRKRANSAKHQTVAWLDLDGDGIPDASRRLDVVTFTHR